VAGNEHTSVPFDLMAKEGIRDDDFDRLFLRRKHHEELALRR
jgi:hypothetical protein